MSSIELMLKPFVDVAGDPASELKRHIEAGKRVIGVGPYHMPAELVTAAGAVPFAVWGACIPVTESSRYFPPFYCSLCQTTLEMGLTGKLEGLSGLMVSGFCDTLRAFSQNWEAGIANRIPMIYVSIAQNRKCDAGLAYMIRSYTDVKQAVQECCDAIIDDASLAEAIRIHQELREELRRFVTLAGSHPGQVDAKSRAAVIQAAGFMDIESHLAGIKQLNDALEDLPLSDETHTRIVLSGIHENIPGLLDMLVDGGFAVVADDLAAESRSFARTVVSEGDPIEALAKGFCDLSADTELYDPKKEHLQSLVDKALLHDAQAVVFLLAKFCDPEEFELPLARAALKKAGIATAVIEVDQSTDSYEQARTKLDALSELLS